MFRTVVQPAYIVVHRGTFFGNGAGLRANVRTSVIWTSKVSAIVHTDSILPSGSNAY